MLFLIFIYLPVFNKMIKKRCESKSTNILHRGFGRTHAHTPEDTHGETVVTHKKMLGGPCPPSPLLHKNSTRSPILNRRQNPGQLQRMTGDPPSRFPAGWGEPPPPEKIMPGGGYPHPPTSSLSNTGLPARARAAVRVELTVRAGTRGSYPVMGSARIFAAAGGGGYPHPPPGVVGGSPPFRKNYQQGEGGTTPLPPTIQWRKQTMWQAMTRYKFNEVIDYNPTKKYIYVRL